MTVDLRVRAVWTWARSALFARPAASRHQQASENSRTHLSPFWEQVAKALTG